MKIVTVLGARPQFIKAATVSRAIRDFNKSESANQIKEIIIHTGQHFDANMSEVFFEQLDIPHPDYNLEISNLSHGAMTGEMTRRVEDLVIKEDPDCVLVYGDTNSTLAGALAAIKLHVPIAHVEAGLRSHNAEMPEEINRVLTDRVSTILFCPTQTAIDNLQKEGFPYPMPGNQDQRIINIGDVMFDAVMYYADRVRQKVSLDNWGLVNKEYILCTLHRQENTNDKYRLDGILNALSEINDDIPVVLPLHPRTKKLLSSQGNMRILEGLRILEPVPYLEMQRLEMGANLILTDSGGVQKEAFFHGVPCITLRDETEWIETVNLGWNYLAGAKTAEIIEARNKLKTPPKINEQPYGDGNAAKKIVSIIQKYF